MWHIILVYFFPTKTVEIIKHSFWAFGGKIWPLVLNWLLYQDGAAAARRCAYLFILNLFITGRNIGIIVLIFMVYISACIDLWMLSDNFILKYYTTSSLLFALNKCPIYCILHCFLINFLILWSVSIRRHDLQIYIKTLSHKL